MTAIVYATTNPGKFREVQQIISHHNLAIKSLVDFGIDIDVDESGETLEQNAKIKTLAYQKLLPSDTIVITDDTGVEIDSLAGEPGIKVRRWKGYKMTDDEIIAYALERLKDVEENKRTAQFRTVIAVAKRGVATRTFSGILPGRIVAEPHKYREEGLPFQPLFFATEYNQMLYQIHTLPMSEKLAQNIITHRERAVISAIPYLMSVI